MKRFLKIPALLLLLLFLSVSCMSGSVKLEYENGQLVNKSKKLTYNPAPLNYEPVAIGEEYAVYGKTQTPLFEIIGLDPKQWLTDEYCSANPAFIIDPAAITEEDGIFRYSTTFIIHSEGLESNGYARKVRVAVQTEEGIRYSAPFTFTVNPIPEAPRNSIGNEYIQTLDLQDTEPPVIQYVQSQKNDGFYRLYVRKYNADPQASVFFWWTAPNGVFQIVEEDFSAVDFVPEEDTVVTLHMGDGLGYVATYTIRIYKP